MLPSFPPEVVENIGHYLPPSVIFSKLSVIKMFRKSVLGIRFHLAVNLIYEDDAEFYSGLDICNVWKLKHTTHGSVIWIGAFCYVNCWEWYDSH